jgi:hypothetical protein
VPRTKAPHQMRPGYRYACEEGIGRTLGQLAAAKMALVAVCRRCKHRRVIYPRQPHSDLCRKFPGHRAPPTHALHELPRPHGQSA